jgi:hypothetical protein
MLVEIKFSIFVLSSCSVFPIPYLESASEAITVFGLLIDVVGATVLAIPNVPIVSEFTKSGRLNSAIQGVEKFDRMIGKRQCNAFISGLKSIDNIEIVDNFDREISAISLRDTDGRHSYVVLIDEQGEEYTIGEPWFDIKYMLEFIAEVYETKIKLHGFVLLVIGFLLQIAAIVFL